MRLRTALNEYKHDRDGRFPKERRASGGTFSGHGDRLAYVGLGDSLRNCPAPLSGLYGIGCSRFGIETGSETRWFNESESARQHYYRETSLVETEYDAREYTVHQYDPTLGRAHVTHVELRDAIPTDARLTAFLTLAPEERETRVGQLIHEVGGPNNAQAVEVFHRNEHDYVTASAGFTNIHGQIPERFGKILSDDTFDFPRKAILDRCEDTHLSGNVVANVPLEQGGHAARTTLVAQLSDHNEMARTDALADLRHCSVQHATAGALRDAAREQAEVFVPNGTPRERIIRAGLRALSLLTAPSGTCIAGPEFDLFCAHSGGYSYTWFRDDAEVTQALAYADGAFSLNLGDRLTTSTEFYCQTRPEDDTWPYRVWTVDRSATPGWAHGRVEGTGDGEYQADQTTSVTVALASLLAERRGELSDELVGRLHSTVAAGVSDLDSSLESDGLPKPCQNTWRNTGGQFTRMAATFLQAYATVATTPVDDGPREHATEQATAVYEGLDEPWSEGRGVCALRIDGNGGLNGRLGSATFVLVGAVDAYADIEDVDSQTANRLVKHMATTLKELYRNPRGGVVGSVRFEDDYWCAERQDGEEVQSVSTAWGASVATKFGVLCDHLGKGSCRFIECATNLYELLQPDGPFTTDTDYLAKQVFNDGRLDSATPLG